MLVASIETTEALLPDAEAAIFNDALPLTISEPVPACRAMTALPAVTGLSSFGAAAFCVVLAAYVVFAYPIMGLADQGAKALGLR